MLGAENAEAERGCTNCPYDMDQCASPGCSSLADAISPQVTWTTRIDPGPSTKAARIHRPSNVPAPGREAEFRRRRYYELLAEHLCNSCEIMDINQVRYFPNLAENTELHRSRASKRYLAAEPHSHHPAS